MADHLTDREQAAIDNYLEHGGTVTRGSLGESGLYDEFGVPRPNQMQVTELTHQRLEVLRKLTAQGVPRREIARRLDMPMATLESLVRRWAGWGESK